jgi:hypothetical protein
LILPFSLAHVFSRHGEVRLQIAAEKQKDDRSRYESQDFHKIAFAQSPLTFNKTDGDRSAGV